MSSLDGLTSLELLDHVDAEPGKVRDEARRRLGAEPMELDESSRLHWIIGLSERALGRFDHAREAIERAASIAAEAHDDTLQAKVHMSLSFVVARLGDLDRALKLLNDAEPRLAGADHARLVSQMGMILYWQGDVPSAAAAMERACEELRSHGDRLGEARVRVNVGPLQSQLGRYARATSHLMRAIEVAQEIGQPLIVSLAQHNLGFMAMKRGDLPGALEQFERAEAGMVAAGADSYLPLLHAEHAQALADAGLLDDAEALLSRAREMLEEQGNDIEVAGGFVTAAELRLARNDLSGARAAAEQAAQWYRKQGREPWVAVATHLALQAEARLDRGSGSVAVALEENAAQLARTGLAEEATRSRLVASLVRAESAGETPPAFVTPDLRRAAGRGRASDQILLAHVDAVTAERLGDLARARRAITRGLKITMSSQAALGSIETRAHAAVHGRALTELGARLAIADGRPMELLLRIEAARLMTSRMPALRPPDDPEMAAMLVELRTLTGTIADPSMGDEQRREAAQERARLERDVRRRSRSVRGDADNTVGLRNELAAALAMLGERQLLAHAVFDGQLHAVSVVDRRARLHELGSIDGVKERIEAISFSLNRLNRDQGSEASRIAAAEMLYMMADELTELLLPPVIAESMRPVIVVPTAALHDVPWGLLPPLGGRSVSINPSVSAWARAARAREEREAARNGLRAVGFMAGPGLEFAQLEVEHLAAEYKNPEVFTGADATGAACVGLLGRADLVHIACHGSFRTDNPMFSSLHLADGPLIVHDLERLHRLPETVVLPACSVANTKALQGGSLLGLATAMVTLGACNVIAPLTPINDASSVTVMQRLHQGLVAGVAPAAALAAATMSHDLADPTAAAFITLGA